MPSAWPTHRGLVSDARAKPFASWHNTPVSYSENDFTSEEEGDEEEDFVRPALPAKSGVETACRSPTMTGPSMAIAIGCESIQIPTTSSRNSTSGHCATAGSDRPGVRSPKTGPYEGPMIPMS
jgi:hypothetical protein